MTVQTAEQRQALDTLERIAGTLSESRFPTLFVMGGEMSEALLRFTVVPTATIEPSEVHDYSELTVDDLVAARAVIRSLTGSIESKNECIAKLAAERDEDARTLAALNARYEELVAEKTQQAQTV